MDYEKELNKEQYEAVRTTQGPLCIIAGAGSGKTRVITYRVAYMIEHGIDPKNILCLTFTNKAADEMRERAAKMLDDRCKEITACTFHSFCSLIMRKYAKLVGLDNDFTIISTSDTASAIDLLKAEKGYTQKKGFPQGKKIAGYISMSINKRLKITDLLVDEGRMTPSIYKDEICELAAEYVTYKKTHKFMDYDDLLSYSNLLLQLYPTIRDRIAEQYKYIMVDEYQDTNKVQEEFLLTLTEKTRNLCVVGDDYQSIYAFRGADASNIVEFVNKVPDAKRVTLTQNYRSDQRILTLANDVMKYHAGEGIYKEMNSDIHDGMSPLVVRTDDQYIERDFVLDMTRTLHDEGIPYNEIAVIFRASHETVLIETELAKEKIPFQKHGGKKFFEEDFVQEALAFLRVIADPHDEIAFFRILKLYGGIGDVYARRIAGEVHKDGYEGLKNLYRKSAFAKSIDELYDKIHSWDGLGLEETLKKTIAYRYVTKEKFIRESNIAEKDKELDRNDKETRKLDVLMLLAKEYNSIPAFLEALALDSATPDDEEEGLQLTTIHSSKGLEYEAVLILDCVDGIFPRTTIEEEHSEEDEEELRCFYVAMTRAKRYLYIMAPEKIHRNGFTERGFVTHYLKNVPYRKQRVRRGW